MKIYRQKGYDGRETRDLINKGEFDKIPQQGRCKDEDIWSWH